MRTLKLPRLTHAPPPHPPTPPPLFHTHARPPTHPCPAGQTGTWTLRAASPAPRPASHPRRRPASPGMRGWRLQGRGREGQGRAGRNLEVAGRGSRRPVSCGTRGWRPHTGDAVVQTAALQPWQQQRTPCALPHAPPPSTTHPLYNHPLYVHSRNAHPLYNHPFVRALAERTPFVHAPLVYAEMWRAAFTARTCAKGRGGGEAGGG